MSTERLSMDFEWHDDKSNIDLYIMKAVFENLYTICNVQYLDLTCCSTEINADLNFIILSTLEL